MIETVIVRESDYVQLRRLPPTPQLERELERALVVSDEALPADVVAMHSRVLYTDETAKLRRLVEIVYPEDADAASGRVSVLAPVGTALLGLAAGQAIDWEFPGGKQRRLRVEEVLSKRKRHELA